jgi:septum site-determining protein MinC
MAIDNLVVFKGTKEGITIHLDANVPFDKVLISFEKKLHLAEKFFQDAHVNIKVVGRKLDEEEQNQFLLVLKKIGIVEVSFLQYGEVKMPVIKKKKELVTPKAPEIEEKNVSKTQFYYGIVRSGQEIYYPGSIVIVGDVNPGGTVKANENIIVLGTLKGKVHVGLDETAKKPFVAALSMQPSQIGIGTVIAQSPATPFEPKKKSYAPQVAYMQERQIYIDEMDMKTIYHMLQ